MTAEQAVQLLLAIVGSIYLGFQAQVIRAKRQSKNDDNKAKVEKQDSAAILALANAFAPLISQMQDQTTAIRDNTKVTNELVHKIGERNDLEGKQRESTLEGQVLLAKHLATNTQTVADLSKVMGDAKDEIRKAIDASAQGVAENSKNLANDIKGAITTEVSKLDGTIVPLTQTFQEAIVALTKALELLTQALNKINEVGANQAEIKKLVEEARAEVKDQLAKPVDAAVLPGPTPPTEPPKETAS